MVPEARLIQLAPPSALLASAPACPTATQVLPLQLTPFNPAPVPAVRTVQVAPAPSALVTIVPARPTATQSPLLAHVMLSSQLLVPESWLLHVRNGPVPELAIFAIDRGVAVAVGDAGPGVADGPGMGTAPGNMKLASHEPYSAEVTPSYVEP